ncbi:MAG TPA: ADOP family duplicated permease [Candidatus Bathyarchaeia archaeon]|jgi:predicted permease|nr:ADOP family duplicated permease [Candidatus Bathyarchaeia archaeon]
MRPEHWLLTIPLRLRSLFRWAQADQELDDELRDHLEQKTEEYVAKGMAHEEARRRARLDLGGVELTKEKCRDARKVNFIENLLQDARFGLRMLWKSRFFTSIAVLTLALGVGANTAVFDLLRAVVFPSLSVPSPNEVFVLYGIRTPNDGAFLYSQPAFERLRESTARQVYGPRIAAHSALAEGEFAVYSGAPVQPVSLQLVSTNFFSVLGVSASAGRVLDRSDGTLSSGGWPVVLRYGFWQEYFNGDLAILGRSQVLNGTLVSIVGVAARNFDGVIPGEAPDLWLPLQAQHDVRYVGPFDSPGDGSHKDLSKPYNQQSTLFWLTLVARVPRGQSAPALARWDAAFEPDREIYERFASPEQKAASGNAHFLLLPAAFNEGLLSATYSKPLLVLMGMVGLLLLIACLNLANLQRTRMLRRSHEFAIRSALGSSRLRLLQQIVAESVPLGLCGGVLSLGIAHVLGSALVRLSSDAPIHLDLRFGLGVYVFCLVLLLVALVVFQILPARRLLFAQALPAGGLTSARGSIGAGGSDGGDAMLGAQIALCVLLLSLAAMFVQTLRNLNGLNAGVDRSHILTVRFDFYNSNFGDAALQAIYPQMIERLRSLPGVRLAVQDMCPPPNCLWNTPVHAAGISGETEAHQDDVGSGYFRTMGIPLLGGREFDDGDRPATTQVAIVNRTLARRLFGSNQNPVGHRLGFGKAPDDATYLVVGEIADIRVDDVRRPPPPLIYLPVAQHFPTRGSLEVRTVNRASTEITNVRTALRAVDTQLPISTITPLDEAYAHTFQTQSLLARLTSLFGILAVILAVIGVYGVQSFRVARRTGEFGVRMALGASRRDVFAMVLGQALRVSAIGGLIGGALAVVFSHTLHNLLFNVHDYGLGSWFLSSLILGGASFLAAFWPARRAMGVNPMVALRYE